MRIATFVAAALGAAGVSSAASLNNGDFEADPFLSGWSQMNPNNPVVPHEGLGGSDAAAFLTTSGMYTAGMDQDFATSASHWQFDLLLANSSVPGSAGLRVYLYSGGRSLAFVEVQSDGSIVTQGGTALFGGAKVVAPSIDADGNNSFSDAGDTLNVYALRLVGRYGAAPEYDVFLGRPGQVTFEYAQLALSDWSDLLRPVAGSGIGRVRFDTRSPALVDQVSLVAIPEPGAAVALAGLLPLVLRRRRAPLG